MTKPLKIDEETHKKIKLLAAKEDRTMTSIVRRAIDKYISEEDK